MWITAEPLEEPRSAFLNLLFAFGPALLLLGGFLWLSSRGAARGAGARALGRSRARRYEAGAVGTEPPRTFADVAGIDEVEAELVEIVDFLKQPEKYQRLGAPPRGCCWRGRPAPARPCWRARWRARRG